MALLPNHEMAELDIAKLRDYCLSPIHPRGKHKAKLFLAALGIGSEDAHWLKEHLLKALQHCEAEQQDVDPFGQRWAVNILLKRQAKHAVVRTVWMINRGSTIPRLVTCWVL
jgi:hypothetical protein